MKRQQLGGLTVLAKHGPEHFGRINKLRSFSAYGDSPAARRIRASDVASRKRLGDDEWAKLMARRSRSFNVPLERLLPALREKPDKRPGR